MVAWGPWTRRPSRNRTRHIFRTLARKLVARGHGRPMRHEGLHCNPKGLDGVEIGSTEGVVVEGCGWSGLPWAPRRKTVSSCVWVVGEPPLSRERAQALLAEDEGNGRDENRDGAVAESILR